MIPNSHRPAWSPAGRFASLVCLIASSGVHAASPDAPKGPAVDVPPLLGVDGGFCGTPLRPQDLAAAIARQQESLQLPEGVTENDYIVPIAYHIVRRSNGTGGMSLEDLEVSHGDLEVAFAGTGITFCTPYGVNYIDSDAFHDDVDTLYEIDQLRQTQVRPLAINVWFTPNLALDGGLQLCGISSFTSSDVQGIVMRNSCGAEGGNASTLAHEVGHYFDLLHTHETALGVECPDGSNCGSAGDLVCDTPADPRLGSGNVDAETCAYIGDDIDPCGGLGIGYQPDPSNHMSYAPHLCRNMFTSQQIQRMTATLIFGRPELALTECPELEWETDPRLELISVTPDGSEIDRSVLSPSLSADGRYVVMIDESDEFVPGDVNDRPDVVLLDRWTGEREIVSLKPNGQQSLSLIGRAKISADGSTIGFLTSDTDMAPVGEGGTSGLQLVIRDRVTGAYTHISRDLEGGHCDGWVQNFEFSRTGEYVAFSTDAPDIVEGDVANPFYGTDVFLHDVATGITERVSVSTAGEAADTWSGQAWDHFGISEDGRHVTFTSLAGNLVDDDTNDGMDVFLRDRFKGTTRRISVDPNGEQANHYSSISFITDDGRFGMFLSFATNIVPGEDANGSTRDLIIKDLTTGETSRVLLANGEQTQGFIAAASVTGDGRWVTVTAIASDIDPNAATDVLSAYVHDRVSGRTRVLNPLTGPFTSDGFFDQAGVVSISADGSFATYVSRSMNILPDTLDGELDVFGFADAIRPADVDDDGTISTNDVLAVLAAWGPCPGVSVPCPADVDGDGAVGFADVLAVLARMD